MTVTLYTKPNCIQCNMTARVLDKIGIQPEMIDVTDDRKAFEYVTKDLGYLAAPVVVVEHEDGTESHWAGFQPEKIKALA